MVCVFVCFCVFACAGVCVCVFVCVCVCASDGHTQTDLFRSWGVSERRSCCDGGPSAAYSASIATFVCVCVCLCVSTVNFAIHTHTHNRERGEQDKWLG